MSDLHTRAWYDEVGNGDISRQTIIIIVVVVVVVLILGLLTCLLCRRRRRNRLQRYILCKIRADQVDPEPKL